MQKSIDLRISGPESEKTLKELSDFFRAPHKIVIVSHQNPDGDAVGSALGLQWILNGLGHDVTVALPDDSPSFLKWLPGHRGILVHEKRSGQKKLPEQFATADLIIGVDFNAPDRLNSMEKFLTERKVPVLLIDHHPRQADFADYFWSDETKGSTSELVYQCIILMGLSDYLTPAAATCLLAGIMTDTVAFKVNCTYPEVFEAVAGLLRCGADKDMIYDEIYSNFSENRMRLLGYSLQKNMTILPEFNTAYIALTLEELNRFVHRKGDTEGFVNYPLSIGNILFSVLFTEQEDHIKLSLRSKGTFPANDFARRYFNGGGHMNASGGRFFGTMAEALTHFEKVLKEFNNLLKGS
jgi:phosphoesterase RecJ-like protein